MNQRCTARGLILWLALLTTGLAGAGTERMDDALTHTVPASAQMQWRPVSAADPSAGMEAWVRVNVHVDTRAWAGRNARIYMVMGPDAGGTVEALWTSQGRLLPGRLTPGQRTLVHAGSVPADSLQDQLQLRLRSGADWATTQRRLHFHFEIDTDR
jgi:hypothetical protein